MYKNIFLKYLLSNNPDEVISKGGVQLRKKFAKQLINMAKPTVNYKLKVIDEYKKPESDQPLIFACTHSFKDDFIFSVKTFREHGYVIFGSLPQFFNTFDGIGAWLLGSILVDRTNKESRNAVIPKAEKVNEYGANTYWFPEGGWNNSPNKLASHLWPGVNVFAKKTGNLIVPNATYPFDDTVYSTVGQPLNMTEHSLEEANQILRDTFATLNYDLIEAAAPAVLRSSLPDPKTALNDWEEEIKARYSVVKYLDPEEEKRTLYIPKELRHYEEYQDCFLYKSENFSDRLENEAKSLEEQKTLKLKK